MFTYTIGEALLLLKSYFDQLQVISLFTKAGVEITDY